MTKCKLCSRKAVIHLKYFDRHLCKNHFIELTEQRIRKNITRNNLLDKEDKIAVAVSGGKDSVSMLHFLYNSIQKYKLDLFGIVVDEGIEGYRNTSAQAAVDNLEKLGVDYKLVKFKDEYGKSMDEIAPDNMERSCTYCGVLRRRILNKYAKEAEADKLATGHNLDDEVQSVFMNYLRGDFTRLKRTGAKTPKLKGFIQRIKIMRDVPENEIELYANLKGFKIHPKRCPYVSGSLRNDTRDMLNEFEEKHPGSKFSLLSGADKLSDLIDVEKFSGPELKECKKCGEPTASEICKVCKLIEKVS
ncbi:MAG: TIGR00269 family protein [Candidatus Undinarchaeales archaeon]